MDDSKESSYWPFTTISETSDIVSNSIHQTPAEQKQSPTIIVPSHYTQLQDATESCVGEQITPQTVSAVAVSAGIDNSSAWTNDALSYQTIRTDATISSMQSVVQHVSMCTSNESANQEEERAVTSVQTEKTFPHVQKSSTLSRSFIQPVDDLIQSSKSFNSDELSIVINKLKEAVTHLMSIQVQVSATDENVMLKDGGVYKCAQCTFGCTSHAEMKHHEATHKSNRCPECAYIACNKSVLNAHIRTHEGELPFICELCPYKASTHLYLSEHVRTVHTNAYEHFCAVCGYCVNGQLIIDKHLLTHNRPKRSGRTKQSCDVPEVMSEVTHGAETAAVTTDPPTALRKKRAALLKATQRFADAEDENDDDNDAETYKKRGKPWWDTAAEFKPRLNDDQVKSHTAYSRRMFLCGRCNISFSSDAGRKKHICTHTNQCIVCSDMKENSETLVEHLLDKHTQQTKKLCLTVNYDLSVSMETVEQSIPAQYKQIQYVEVREVEADNTTSSNVLDIHRCITCQLCFADQLSRDNHVIEQTCSRVTKVRCHGCEFSCAGDQMIEHHLDNHTEFNQNSVSEVIKATVSGETSQASDSTADAQLLIEAMTNAGVDNSVTMHMSAKEKLASGKFTLVCKLCPMIIDNPEGYLSHIQALHIGDKIDGSVLDCVLVDVQQCLACNAVLENKDKLEQHLHLHTGGKPYICLVCQNQFRDTRTLKTHIMSHEKRCKPRDKSVCEVCGYSTIWKKNYERHMKSHSGVRDFRCEYPDCTYATYEKDMLNKHITNIHNRDSQPKLLCQICGYQTINKYALKAHVEKHDSKKRYKCEQCSFATKHSSSLIIHVRSHTGYKPFVCSMCGKSFSTNSELKKHEKRHAGLIERKHKCTLCDKQYSTPQHLVVHMRTHTGQRPFKCHICSFAATSKSVLVNHMPTHTGEKNYKCHLCEFTCASSGTLSNHRRLKHKIVNKRKTLAEATPESLMAAAEVAGLTSKKKRQSAAVNYDLPVTTAAQPQISMNETVFVPMSGITPLAASIAGIPGINMPPPTEIPAHLLTHAVRQALPPY